MKKILFLTAIMLFTSTLSFAQYWSPITLRAGAYGGVNFTGNNPNVGAFVSVQDFNLMAEIDVGWSRIGEVNHDFCYVNPSVGFYVGNRFRAYALIGLTTWAGVDMMNGEIRSDRMFWKIKCGIDVSIWRRIFLNVNWNYLFQGNAQNHRVVPFGNNSLNFGIGYVF